MAAAIADMDQNGWLDLILISYQASQVTILYGRPDGYSEEHAEKFYFPSAIECEVADLNGDGWLDLLVSSYDDPVSKNRDLGFAIAWGGRDGIQSKKMQWLPGWTPIGLAVADLDDDNYLDIISPSYHAELNRQDIPSYIYWGGPEGYSVKARTPLMISSAHDVVVGDFNGDELPDLAFSAHTANYTHRIESPIFFNDGKRFRHSEVQYLPTQGSHFIYAQDIGNIADRSFEEYYESPVLSWNEPARKGRGTVRVHVPDGTELLVEVRAAANGEALKRSGWKVANEEFSVGETDRYLQYRVRFVSPNGDSYPVLSSVKLNLWD